MNDATNIVVFLDGKRYALTAYGWVDAATRVGVPTAMIGAIEEAAIAQGLADELARARRAPSVSEFPDEAFERGAHSATPGVRRTHCYNCKRTLDSERDAACTRCGWLICACGACGCQYAACIF